MTMKDFKDGLTFAGDLFESRIKHVKNLYGLTKEQEKSLMQTVKNLRDEK